MKHDGFVQSNGERIITRSWINPENHNLAESSATMVDA